MLFGVPSANPSLFSMTACQILKYWGDCAHELTLCTINIAGSLFAFSHIKLNSSSASPPIIIVSDGDGWSNCLNS